jgi:TolB-like protein
MIVRRLMKVVPLIVGLSSLLVFAGAAFSADLLTKDRSFKDPDDGAWDFIPDYTDMAEGDGVDWVWTKPGVNLGQYKTVAVPEFENHSSETDVTAQDLLTRNMKDGLERRLGLKTVDKNADITVKGAMVDYSSGSTAARVFVGYGSGEPNVTVEVYVIDNKTNEIISKVRHEARDYSIDSAIAETISDVINYWAHR